MPPKPAVSLAAVAGRRKATLELAQRIEQEGFSGIYCPSFGDGMGQIGRAHVVFRLLLAGEEAPGAKS